MPNLATARAQRFHSYVERLTTALGHRDRHGPLRAYVTGLCLPGDRKSIEPMAARLEQATKDYHAELVVSEDVGRYAGIDLSAFRRDDLAVRNRAGRVPVRVITRVRELP